MGFSSEGSLHMKSRLVNKEAQHSEQLARNLLASFVHFGPRIKTERVLVEFPLGVITAPLVGWPVQIQMLSSARDLVKLLGSFY